MNFMKKSVSFNPEKDIPSLDGKVILVTGGNIGLGKQTILEYAKHNPALIWLAARNSEKAQAAIDDIQSQLSKPANIKFLELDLCSLESVKKAASKATAESERLDILLLNAGIMAAPPALTNDGYEIQFGTNYLGHALLFKLLTPLLSRTASLPHSDVRITMVTSAGHKLAPKGGINYDSLRTDASSLGPYTRYGQSKLAQILWANSASKHFPQFNITSIHPGVVDTNLINGATDSPAWMKFLAPLIGWFVTPVDQGARNQLWASVGEGVKSGEYYEPVGVKGCGSRLSQDEELARGLWEWTGRELGGYSI